MNASVILNNGVKMPIIGFGLWALYSNECIQCVKDAISVGYRLFDTAQVYRNERELGEGIRQSKFPRSELFVTTKTGTNGYAATKKGIEQSLKRFGFPYFDLIIIHWSQSDNIGTYRALEEAYKDQIGSSADCHNKKQLLNNYISIHCVHFTRKRLLFRLL